MLWPAGIGFVMLAAGFALAHEGRRLDPGSFGELLLALLLLGIATALVLSAPWIVLVSMLAEVESLHFLHFVILPHLALFGATEAESFAGWLAVVALGSWLTFRYESLWVQFCVLLFALAPLPILYVIAVATMNA